MHTGQLRRHIEKRIPITDEDFEILMGFVTPLSLHRKQTLVKSGDVCDFQGYIVKGCMRQFLTDEHGDEHIVQFGFEDWYIGDMMSFLTGQPADYTVEALEDCELLVFQRDRQDELYEKLPGLERYFRIMIQHAFVASQQRLVSIMRDSAEERYVALTRKYSGLELRVAQHHIASFLGISPEALSRIRKKLIRPSL